MKIILDTPLPNGHVKVYTHRGLAHLECEPCDLYVGNDGPRAISHRRMRRLAADHARLHADIEAITAVPS